ncbi:MAG: hypothetical protein HYV27_24340 [Candidatus Hydrogenedentes bacterium]|nr:hypothetical protein [Candidatus Hydrogenedentota bacterium]
MKYNQLEFQWEMKAVHAAPAAPPAREDAQYLADALCAQLRADTGWEIHLRITNNASTMMTLRHHQTRPVARVGLHHMFLRAPQPVRKALATWIKRPASKVAGKVLNQFIKEQNHLIKAKPVKAEKFRTVGVHADLMELFREVNAEYFSGRVDCGITWGRMPATRRRRSIRFGSYVPGDHLIRIHPLLDQACVPRYFIRYIVFHEMLHADMGIGELPSGRRVIHSAEFKKREQTYAEYARALEWMENPKNMARLLAPQRS